MPLTGEGSLIEFQHLRTEHPIEIGEEIEHSTTEQGELPQSIEISPIDVIYESPTKTRRKKSPQNIDFVSDVSQVDVAPSIKHLKNILTVNEVAHYEIAQKEDEEPISSLATRRDISNVPHEFEIYTTSTDIYDTRERNQLEINEPRIFDHLHEDLIESQFELSDLNTLSEIQCLEKSELHVSKKLVFEETENENNEQQQQLNFSHVVIHELQPVLEDQEHKDLSLIEQNDVIYDQAPQGSEEDREKSLNFSISLPEIITNEEDEQKMTTKVMIDDESIIELEQSENPSFELSDIVHENYSEEDEVNLLSKKFSIQHQKAEFIDNKSEIQGHKQEDQNKAQLYISLQDEFEQVLNLPEMDMSDVHDYSKSEAKQVNVSISPTEIIYESRIVNEQAFNITIPTEVYSQNREESGTDQEIKEPKEETKNELHICENANNNINITESNKSELECSAVETYSKEEEANFELSELSQYSVQFALLQEPEIRIEEEEEEPEEELPKEKHEIHLVINEGSILEEERYERESSELIISSASIQETSNNDEQINNEKQPETKNELDISPESIVEQSSKELSCTLTEQESIYDQEPANDGEGINFSISTPEILPLNVTDEKAKRFEVDDESIHAFEKGQNEGALNELSINEVADYEVVFDELQNAPSVSRDIQNVARREFEIFNNETDIYEERSLAQLIISSASAHENADEQAETKSELAVSQQSVIEKASSESIQLNISSEINEFESQQSSEQQDAETSTEGRHQLRISHEVIQEIEPAQEQDEDRKQQINFSISSPEIFSNEEEEENKTNKGEGEDKVELNISKEEDIEIFEKKETNEDSHVIDSESIIEFSLHTKPIFSISSTNHEISLEDAKEDGETSHRRATLSIENQRDLFDLFEEEIQANNKSLALEEQESQYIEIKNQPNPIEITSADIVYESPLLDSQEAAEQQPQSEAQQKKSSELQICEAESGNFNNDDQESKIELKCSDIETYSIADTATFELSEPSQNIIRFDPHQIELRIASFEGIDIVSSGPEREAEDGILIEEEEEEAESDADASKEASKDKERSIKLAINEDSFNLFESPPPANEQGSPIDESSNFEKERSGTELSNDVISFETPNKDTGNRPSLDSDSVIQIEQNESPAFDVSEAVHEQRNDSLVRDGPSRMRISSNSQSYEQRVSPALFSYQANDIFSVDQIRSEKENQKKELDETVILESSLPIEFENFFNSQNEISDSLCLSSNNVTNTQISNDIHSFEIQNNSELNGLSISNEIESSFGPTIQSFSFTYNVEQFDIVSNVSVIDKNVDLPSKRVDVSISASLSNENLISQNDKIDLIVSPLSLNEVIGVGSDLVLVAGTQLDLPPSDSIVRNEYHGEKLNLVTSLAQEYQVHSDNDSNLSIGLSGQFDQPQINDELAISPCNGQIDIEPSNVILQSNENEQVTIERNHTDLLVNKVVEENQVFEVSSNNDRLNNQLSESYFLSMNIMNSSDDSENSNENEPMKDLNSIIQERNMSIKERLTIESFDDISGDYSSNTNLLENSSTFTVFDYDQRKEAKNCQINSIEQVSFEPYESLYEIMNINSFDIIPQQDSNIHPIVTDDNAPKKHIKLEVAQPQVNEINDDYNNSNEDTSNNNNNNNNEDANNYLPVLSSSRVFHFGFNQLVDVYKPAVVLEISEEALEIDLDISSGPIKAKIEKADQYTINLSNSNPVERNLFIDTNNNNYSIIFSNGLSYSHTESFEAINEDIDNNDLEALSSISPDARLMLIKRQMKEIKDLRSELVKRGVANESIKKKYDNLKSAARECLMKHFSDVRRLTDDNVSLKEQVESLHKLVGSNLDSAQQSILSLMRHKVIASLDFADKITVFEKVPLNRKLTIQGENELEIDRPDIRAGTKVLVTFTAEDVEPNDSEFERFLSKRGISVKEDDQKMHSKSYYKVNKLYLSNLTASVDCRSTFSNLRQTGKVTHVSEPPSYRSFALKVSDSSDTFEKPEPKNEFSFSFYHLRVSRPKFPPVLHLEDNSAIAHICTPLPPPVQPTTATPDQGEEKEEKSGNDSDSVLNEQKETSIEKVVQKPLRRNIVRNSFFIENDNGLKNFSNDKSAPLNGFYCSFVNASSFSILPQEKPRLVQACNEQFEASAVSLSELHVKKTQAFDFAYEASDETDSDSIEAIVSRPLMLSIPIVHSVASSEEKKKKDRDDNDFEIQISYEFFNLDRNNKEKLAIDDASSFYEVSGDDTLNADDDNSKREKLQLSPSIANSFNKKPSAGKKSPKQETLAAENISPNVSDNDNKFEKEIYQSEVKDLQISEFDTFEMLPEDNQNDSEMVITMLRRRVTTLNEELKMQNLRQSELISEMAHIRSNYEDLLRSRAQ